MITSAMIHTNIIQDWIEHKMPTNVIIQRMCISLNMKDLGHIDITGTGWAGEAFIDADKDIKALDALDGLFPEHN